MDMASKKVVSYYMEFNSMFFQKENLLKPLLLAKSLGCKCEIYYGQNTDVNPLPNYYNGADLICQNYKGEGIIQLIKVSWIIIKEAKNISNLMTFHASRNIAFFTLLLKFFNPKASVWVSGDIEIGYAYRDLSNMLCKKKGLKGLLTNYLYKSFFNKLDVYTVETKRVYYALKPLFDQNGLNNLVYQPCGVDKDNLNKLVIPSISKKENIVLSVSRFGPHQKNTEMLLDGLAKAELKDWKVFLVGPITTDFSLNKSSVFNEYIESFFETHPNLKEKIIFTGPIFDAKELNELFSKAKIFVMTSRHEAFANVFAQARWYRCHILSTDVGGAQDMSNDWEYGTCTNQEDPDDFADKLSKLIDGAIKYPTESFASEICYQYLLEKTIKPYISV